jgi:hydrogenase maturation protease
MRIICCGNPERGDDGAGALVARRLRELGIEAETCTGEASELLEAWSGAGHVTVVDAVETGAPAGTVSLWDGGQATFPVRPSTSTHGLGLAEAITLARVLDSLPEQLRVYGIEGRQFEPGTEVSPEVKLAVEEVVRRISAAAVVRIHQSRTRSITPRQ